MKVKEKNLIYLYCVTDKVPKLKEVADFVAQLYFIYHRGIYAIVSKVRESEFSEDNLKKNMSDFAWIKGKVSAHEVVIEGIMKYACVIPFKFGTIFNAEDNLKTMLEKEQGIFRENLEKLEGKEEWGVKIYCDMEKLKSYLIKEDEEYLEVDRQINISSPGRAFFLKRKKEELLSAAVNSKINEYGEDSFNRLKEPSREARINKLLSKEVTEREDDMVLNSGFLVDKSKVAEFIRGVDGLKKKYNSKGLDFICTGPWPPYNFCSLHPDRYIG